MRAACRALVWRHAGLRARPYGTAGDDAIASLCNGAAPVVTALRALLGPGSGSKGRLCLQAAEGLMAAWPRISCGPISCSQSSGAGPEEAHFEWLRYGSEAELRRSAWMRARTRGFRQPASIAVLLLAIDSGQGSGQAAAQPGSNGDRAGLPQREVAYLHVAVNHAVTDAASVVPMVSDLLSLHQAARAARTEGAFEPQPRDGAAPAFDVQAQSLAKLAATALPPAPNGLEVQHARLRGALLPLDSLLDVGDATLDLAHNAFHPRRRGYDHYIRLLPGACRVLSIASAALGVPQDHLLVAALAVAFGQIADRAEVGLSLIVPMRDSRGDNQVVANLATTRHLSAWVGGSRSLLAVALDLSTRLRRREWALSDVLGDDGDRFFINVRGIPGFDGASPVMEAVDTTRKPTRFVRNLVEMFADQETAESWTLWMGIRDDLDGSALARALRCALWGLAMDPLVPLAPMPAPASAKQASAA